MTIPDYFEAPLGDRGIRLGTFGSAEWKGVDPDEPRRLVGGHLRLMLRAPKLRVYDIWAEVDGGWVQLNPVPGQADAWANEDLAEARIDRLRLWVGASWDMTLEPAPPRKSTLVEPEVAYTPPHGADPSLPPGSTPYVPVVEGEPPLPSERESVRIPSRVRQWVKDARDDVVVIAFLEDWTQACAGAAGHGWMVGLPRGEDLLEVYARTAGADRRIPDHDQGFARWLTIEVGRATRSGLLDRRELEARRPGARLLHEALQNLVRALADDLSVDFSPPAIVGTASRHEWLVDDHLAAAVDNPVLTPGSHRPIFVLRPRLARGVLVVVEGEVV
ncbi:MAG: hypothetical protein H6737_13035 [Alphaproteobacteria bacterium]|nr:hypothetical protein [Alphaproteobacteria bacterium]